MQSHGVGSHITISTSPKSGLNKLSIGSSSDLTQWMLEAMEELLANVLHPKIQLLKDFLEAPKHRISNIVITTRLSFFEYLNIDIEDSLMLVLGQDTHPLKLSSFNSMLAFAGLDQIDNIRELKLDVFKEQAEQLEQQTGPKTETQTIFLR